MDRIAQQIAIATGADQRGAVAIWKKAAQNQRENEQSIMPKRSNEIAGDRLADDTRPVDNFETQSASQQPQQLNSKRDQPARFPAIDLQDFLRARRPAV